MRPIAYVFLAGALALGGCVSPLFYQPSRRLYQTPADVGLPFEEASFRSADGTPLHGWFLPARGRARGTVIHFHGNAQNMSAHFRFVDWLPGEGFNVFVFDYRGYGHSGGTPDRRGLVEDGRAAIRYVRSRPDVDTNRIVVLAQSLGGANAVVALATLRAAGVRAVALESTFSSYRAIVRDKIALIPVLAWLRGPLSYVLVSNRYSPDAYIARLAPMPVLLLHGTADPVVPYRHAGRLFDAAAPPKDLWTLEGAGHTEAFAQQRERYAPLLATFFCEALDGNNP